jgi:hypothetical protein
VSRASALAAGLLIVFLFSEFIQIQANFKILYIFGLNSEKYEAKISLSSS